MIMMSPLMASSAAATAAKGPMSAAGHAPSVDPLAIAPPSTGPPAAHALLAPEWEEYPRDQHGKVYWPGVVPNTGPCEPRCSFEGEDSNETLGGCKIGCKGLPEPVQTACCQRCVDAEHEGCQCGPCDDFPDAGCWCSTAHVDCPTNFAFCAAFGDTYVTDGEPRAPSERIYAKPFARDPGTLEHGARAGEAAGGVHGASVTEWGPAARNATAVALAASGAGRATG